MTVCATSPSITVIGTGYLGAKHAICMAVLGHEVLGIDTDKQRIAALGEGRVAFYEPGLPEILHKALDSGRLQFGTDIADAAAFGDVHFVASARPGPRTRRPPI
jgi:UDPglucose 6-dehydrogenase